MMNQKMNRMKVTALILTAGFLFLTSCNFPLSMGRQGPSASDLDATSAALKSTSDALQLTLANPAAPTGEQAATPSPQILPTVELATATPQITHLIMPGEPSGNHESGMTDADSAASAPEKRAIAGENFAEGLLERPFNANTMDIYFPELDIVQAWLNHTETWMYVMIRLHGVDANGKLSGAYAVEFDLNVDGRGDFLILANQPASTWSVDGVEVWQDTNKDIGHNLPVGSDPPQTGDGYDKNLFKSGQGSDADMAWARIDPNNPQVVQIALKYSTINNDAGFMWGVWAQDVFHPDWFDYNDHFTLAEAGSASTLQTQYYPIKALAQVDNSCRWTVGFTPTGGEPGICYVPATPTPLPTNTSEPVPGTITGIVFNDFNLNKTKQSGEWGLSGATVSLLKGSCSSSGSTVSSGNTDGSGVVTFTGINPGKYCLKVTSAPPGGYSPVAGSGPVTVTLSGGGSVTGYLPYVIYIY
jgi:hypothetical protein